MFYVNIFAQTDSVNLANKGLDTLYQLPTATVQFQNTAQSLGGIDHSQPIRIPYANNSAEGYLIGIKALAKAGSDEVLAVATLSGKNTSKSLKFRNADNKDIEATVLSKGNNIYHYTLKINASNAATCIYAYIQNGTTTGQNIAKLSTKAYEKVTRTVVLVPIATGVIFPANLEAQINQIYKQAIAEIKVEIAPEIILDITKWDKVTPDGLLESDNKVRGNYPPEMQGIANAYEKSGAQWLFRGI